MIFPNLGVMAVALIGLLVLLGGLTVARRGFRTQVQPADRPLGQGVGAPFPCPCIPAGDGAGHADRPLLLVDAAGLSVRTERSGSPGGDGLRLRSPQPQPTREYMRGRKALA
jgi:hypothetical protein